MMDSPVWLTKEFIQSALQENDSDIKVNYIKINNAVSEGNNYICKILRVNVFYLRNGDSKVKSLIIKVPMQDASGITKEFLEEGIAKKEVRMYNEYFPKIKMILSLYEAESITPDSYPSIVDDVLILEDLNHSGYKMADRLERFDFNHCVVALKTLATFHATSFILYNKEPEFVESVGKDLIFRGAKKDSQLEDFIISTLNILADELEPEFERFSKCLQEVGKSIWSILLNILQTTPDDFSVLAHGDFWVTNMMFKYNDQGIPQFAKLLDLQETHYTSPAIDIIHFFHGSVREDIRISKRDELIEIYLNELNRHLSKLGSTRHFSRTELDHELEKRKMYSLFINVTVLPIILADAKECKIVSLDENVSGIDENNPIRNYYKNKLYKNIISKRLIELEENGIFNTNQ